MDDAGDEKVAVVYGELASELVLGELKRSSSSSLLHLSLFRGGVQWSSVSLERHEMVGTEVMRLNVRLVGVAKVLLIVEMGLVVVDEQ